MACLTNYAVQCTDATTGVVGCFLFDINHWKMTGKFRAVSPVFPDLVSFFAGTTADQRMSIYAERTHK